MTLKLNDDAPDFNAILTGNEPFNFHKALNRSPICLIFLRYIGCPICRQRLTELEGELNQYIKQDVRLIVVLESPMDRVEDYFFKKAFNLQAIPDPDRKLYDLFDVEKGKIGAILHPQVLKSAAKATVKGHMHGAPGGSETQLPAAFVATKDAKLAYVNYGEHAADTPPTETILANSPPLYAPKKKRKQSPVSA
ncbi:MAG: redoxin domain-containing protein [Pseudomonadales bacterium]|nr:redoxin domain-containing protein [Pseudomonadales bacterium]